MYQKTLHERMNYFDAESVSNKKRGFSTSFLSGKWDSNPRPLAWEANALPAELCPPSFA